MTKPTKNNKKMTSKTTNGTKSDDGRLMALDGKEKQPVAEATPRGAAIMPVPAVVQQQPAADDFQTVFLNALYNVEASLRREISSTRQEIIDRVQVIQNELREIKTEQKQQHMRLKATEDKQKRTDSRMDSAEQAILNLERYSRNFNALFFGFPEVGGEVCKATIENFIRDILKMKERITIEMAHRLGARKQGDREKVRPIIVKFIYREEKARVLTTARQVLRKAAQYVTEDLPKEDLDKKRRLAPTMKQAWEDGEKVSFRGGKLYINGKEFLE